MAKIFSAVVGGGLDVSRTILRHADTVGAARGGGGAGDGGIVEDIVAAN